MNPASENSVTIMKYKDPNGVYDFKCLDKWNVEDEIKRLDVMLKKRQELEAMGYKVLWIKTLPIFDIPPEMAKKAIAHPQTTNSKM